MTATPVGRAYLLFWTVSIALLCLGMLVSIALQVFETPRLYDFVAFLLSALTSTAFALQRDLRRHIRIAMDVLLHILCTTQFVLAALLLLRVRYVGPIDTFYENERFQGWSMNPNQLAFVLLALPFLAIHRLGEQKTLPRRAWYGVLALLPILPGALCFSNALFFAWISGIAVLSLAAWVRLVAWKDSRFLRRAFWTILVPTAAAGILAFLGPALYRLSVTGLDRGFNYGRLLFRPVPVVRRGRGAQHTH
jgi:hypothetical protein